MEKSAYICGPLTELSADGQVTAKKLYVDLARQCGIILGVRAFVPHEHCDPIQHFHLTPAEVDAVERRQVCECTSVLVVVVLAPSWGGGIEVEMSFRSGVPVLILSPKGKKVSRLLLGNPGIVGSAEFEDSFDAICALGRMLEIHKERLK